MIRRPLIKSSGLKFERNSSNTFKRNKMNTTEQRIRCDVRANSDNQSASFTRIATRLVK